MRKKNFPFLLYYLVYWMGIACLSPYLGLFYQERGLTGSQIGILYALSSVISVPAALCMGPLADRSKAPKRILALLVAGVMLSFGLMYLMHGFIALAVAALCYGFASSPTADIADGLLMDQIRETPELFGNFRLGGSVGYIFGVAVSGFLMKQAGLPTLFVAASCSFLLTLAVIYRMPTSPPERAQERPERRLTAPFRSIVRNRAFAPAFLTLIIWGLTESGVVQFLSLHVVSNGKSAEYTSILIGSAMVGEFVFFAAAPFIVRKLGPMPSIVLGFLLQAIRLSALAFIDVLPAALLIASQVLGGGAFSLVYSADTQYIQQSFDASVSYTAQALKSVANKGIGVSLGSLVYGWMLDVLTTNAAFGSMAVLAILYMFILLVLTIMRKKNNKIHQGGRLL